MPQLAAEYELRGWVRSEEIPDTKALADELARAHSENRELRKKLTAQEKRLEETHSAISGEEMKELFELLSSLKIDISSVKHFMKGASSNEASILELALTVKDMLMRGVENRFGVGELESFAYFSLCPKLQTYELVQNEKVASVRYRRYAITKKGIQFFAALEESLHKVGSSDRSSERKVSEGRSSEKKVSEGRSNEKKVGRNKKAQGNTSVGDLNSTQ